MRVAAVLCLYTAVLAMAAPDPIEEAAALERLGRTLAADSAGAAGRAAPSQSAAGSTGIVVCAGGEVHLTQAFILLTHLSISSSLAPRTCPSPRSDCSSAASI
jgi:hypothetical protein